MLTDKMRSELEEYAKIGANGSETEALYEAAVQFAESYTGKAFKLAEDGPVSQLYWLAIKQIFLHWYDNRGAASEKTLNEIPLSAHEVLNHIALSSEFEVIA